MIKLIKARMGAAIGCIAFAVLPAVLPLRAPEQADLEDRNRPMFSAPIWERTGPGGSLEIGPILGSDDAGRCLLSRLLHGVRLSLVAALAGGAVCLAVGTAVGLYAGWRGGRTDRWIMRGVDTADALPTIALVILAQAWIRAAGGPFTTGTARSAALFIVLGGATWFLVARLVRAKTRWLSGRGFVEAALSAGIPASRVVRTHIIPNLDSVLAAAAAATIPRLVLFEAFLSFLGLGVEPPRVSLGALARHGFDAFSMVSPRWGPLLLPCAALAIVSHLAGRVFGSSPPSARLRQMAVA